jgi:glucose-6-phosphate 1-dehydrogenase
MMKTDSQLAPRVQQRELGTSDSFVFFGATGDLAYKQIFPSLQQMILRDNFDLPIIGVAKSGWTIEQLQARVRDSLAQHGGLDEKAYAKLVQLMQYIGGDYQDPKTFEKLHHALGEARSPLHYLAIPRSCPDHHGRIFRRRRTRSGVRRERRHPGRRTKSPAPGCSSSRHGTSRGADTPNSA